MKIRFGVFADLHTDFMHDSVQRVEQFIKICKKEQVDFAIQLGDFCPPNGVHMEEKKKILEQLKKSTFPVYHVIGNHDTDANTKDDVLEFLDEKKAYYSFDKGGIHFVVLDANYYFDGQNYVSYEQGNYRYLPPNGKVPMIPPKELRWLEKDLQKTEYPTVIFSHQSLIESRAGIRNARVFRKVIRKAPKGVLMAICGHEHVDRLEKKAGVWYYCVNSMSYYWSGSKYRHDTYEKSITANYPKLESIFPYKDPLFALIEIEDDFIKVRGVESEIVGNIPEEIGFKKWGLCDAITPSITERKIGIGDEQNESL